MKRRPRDIGTAAETAVVKYLHTAGFPHAERRSLRGALDAGDITGTPSVAWEVKGGDAARAASDLMIERWMAEVTRERENAKADVGLLVIQRAGVGPANAGRWWAVLPLSTVALLRCGIQPPPNRAVVADASVRMLLADAVTLLRAAGYGDPEVARQGSEADCERCAAHLICPTHDDPRLARPVVAPYLPAAATPEGIEDIARPGLDTVTTGGN